MATTMDGAIRMGPIAKLCCQVNAFGYCHYCKEQWCIDCWFESGPASNWIGTKCPIPSTLSPDRRGGHADMAAGMSFAGEEEKYDRQRLPELPK